jgi:hypothetical protein
MIQRIWCDRRVARARVCVAAVLAFLVFGCGSSPQGRPAALDPSNPNNAESPSFPAIESLSADPVVAKEAPVQLHAHHHGSSSDGDMTQAKAPSGAELSAQPSSPDAGAVIYSCPMHPEVHRAEPGACPKCGMKLVPAGPGATTSATDHPAMDGGRP